MRKTFVDYFYEISAIPRESGHEDKIRAYFIAYAKRKNLEYAVDDIGNVVISKKASKKYDHCTPIVLQGHMDMVCEKEHDSTHDFSKDAISIIEKDGFLTADGTTLGADNGIACAMALALMDQEETPALEFVATVREEVDMAGALNFSYPLKGKYFINIDSEEEGVIVCGSAGGETAVIRLKKETEPSECQAYYTLHLHSLQGGHSGMEIDRGFANGIRLMAKFLEQNEDLKLCQFSGGTKDNAICREVTVVVGAERDLTQTVSDFIRAERDLLNEKDQLFQIEVSRTQQQPCLSEDNRRALIRCIMQLPHGVHSRFEDGSVESSSNLAIVKEMETCFEIVDSIRSASKKELRACKEKIMQISDISDISFEGAYPTWEYLEQSVLREKAKKLYFQRTGKEMKEEIIHAGLECGVFSEKFSGLECISIGPDIFDVHTTNERLDLSSSQRFFKYLNELITVL